MRNPAARNPADCIAFGSWRQARAAGVSAPVLHNRRDTLAVSAAPTRESLKPAEAQEHGATQPAQALQQSWKTRKAAAPADTMRARGEPKPVSDTARACDTCKAVSAQPDTVHKAGAKSGGCAADTAPPWVYPDPSGGLHRHAVRVVLVSTKPCVVEWKADSAAPFKTYNGDSISITSTSTIFFKAHDSCSNVMDERQEYYEIATEDAGKHCPPDMEFVKAGQTRFCIDHYEWPNRFKAIPQSFISLFSAEDSCLSVGKRLCNSDEWTLACTGPYAWKYPYGNSYEPRACVSRDTTARPSGSKPECRGYFEVFDMAGNLAEWTDTRSDKNPAFFNVRGGFWDSGPHTGCFDTRYSYYPQNRHNPVGFRCCKDAASR